MTKCFSCIKDEYYKKIKWSKVEDAVVIFNGTGYCYKHLEGEIGWNTTRENDEEGEGE